MKKVKIAVIGILCVALLAGTYLYISHNSAKKQEEAEKLTEFEKVITRDLEKSYPETPRSVVKFYNRILKCFYNEEYTDEQFYQLADQARALMDEELKENNPQDAYYASLKEDIEEYHASKRTIASTNVADSNDVTFQKVDGSDCAYVAASYFMREGNDFKRTKQEYVLRKDEDGKWKILVFYLKEGDTADDDE